MAGKTHVRKGDTVVVLSGKEKGKRGKVLTVLPAERKVVVEGVAVAKKHQRPTKATMQGGIIDQEMPIDASNVIVVCPACGRTTRHGHKVLADGRTVRSCKHCGEPIDK